MEWGWSVTMGISEQPNTVTCVFFPFILIISYTYLNLRKKKKKYVDEII